MEENDGIKLVIEEGMGFEESRSRLYEDPEKPGHYYLKAVLRNTGNEVVNPERNLCVLLLHGEEFESHTPLKIVKMQPIDDEQIGPEALDESTGAWIWKPGIDFEIWTESSKFDPSHTKYYYIKRCPCESLTLTQYNRRP